MAKYFVVWFLSTHTQYICTEHTHTKIICLAGVIINLLRNSQNTRMYIIILACLCSLKRLHVSISLSPILMQTATVYYKLIPTYWIRARDNSEYQTSKYTPNATAKSVSIKHRSQWSAVFLHRVFRCLSSFWQTKNRIESHRLNIHRSTEINSFIEEQHVVCSKNLVSKEFVEITTTTTRIYIFIEHPHILLRNSSEHSTPQLSIYFWPNHIHFIWNVQFRRANGFCL